MKKIKEDTNIDTEIVVDDWQWNLIDMVIIDSPCKCKKCWSDIRWCKTHDWTIMAVDFIAEHPIHNAHHISCSSAREFNDIQTQQQLHNYRHCYNKNNWKFFVFDTETTWIGLNDQIVQFSWIFINVVDWKFYQERIINQYINPTVPISKEAYVVHWISKDLVSRFSTIDDYLPEFLAYIKKADCLVCHNYWFDSKMLQQEIDRIWYKTTINNKRSFCTMAGTTNIVKLPWYSWWYKRPSLQELHTFCFWEWFEDWHDSLIDVQITVKCLEFLLNNNIIEIEMQ